MIHKIYDDGEARLHVPPQCAQLVALLFVTRRKNHSTDDPLILWVWERVAKSVGILLSQQTQPQATPVEDTKSNADDVSILNVEHAETLLLLFHLLQASGRKRVCGDCVRDLVIARGVTHWTSTKALTAAHLTLLLERIHITYADLIKNCVCMFFDDFTDILHNFEGIPAELVVSLDANVFNPSNKVHLLPVLT